MFSNDTLFFSFFLPLGAFYIDHVPHFSITQVEKRPWFKPRVGQYCFLNVDEISKFEWHAITLSSAPEETYASVHIRVVGDWTTKLAKYGRKSAERVYVCMYVCVCVRVCVCVCVCVCVYFS